MECSGFTSGSARGSASTIYYTAGGAAAVAMAGMQQSARAEVESAAVEPRATLLSECATALGVTGEVGRSTC